MNDTALTPAAILEAAEDVLRRYGPAKATVIDVSRALGVSHGSVYRHYASKAELRDAVTAQWLARIDAPLAKIVAQKGNASTRLRRWLETLFQTKRGRALDDPELHATYLALGAQSRGVVMAHVAGLIAQIERIIADGITQGEFAKTDPAAAARAVFDATVRFHKPSHAPEWADPGINAAFDRVCTLILHGLGVR